MGASWGLASRGRLGDLWGPLGDMLGVSEAVLEGKAFKASLLSPSWAPLGAFLGVSMAVLVASWAVLRSPWAILGPTWAVLGPSWGSLGLSRNPLGDLAVLGFQKPARADMLEVCPKPKEHQ